MKKEVLEAMRIKYGNLPLNLEDVAKEPVEQFKLWFKNASESGIYEPNAMTLSTVSPEGKPSARIVLLKGFDEKGFIFYTNYEGRKGKQLAENPFAALTFYWDVIHRQVRIEGKVKKLSAKASTAYFQKRPKGSQIGAWASPQSQAISGREILEENVADLIAKHEEDEVLPRPKHWGGYVVIPERIEFWQGRDNRLHDRVAYEKKGRSWKTSRLAP